MSVSVYGHIDKQAAETAKLCLFFDQLFDSVNGSFDKIINGKIYRTAVKSKSPHHDLWANSLKVLKSMEYVNIISGKRTNPQPRVITNWMKTIRGNFNINNIIIH